MCIWICMIKKFSFLVQFIMNCYITLSLYLSLCFWTPVFSKNFSSTIQQQSNTIFFFIYLNSSIFWQGRTCFRLTELRKGLDGVLSVLTCKSLDAVSLLLLLPVGDDLSWWSQLSKAAIVNMSLEKWLQSFS